MIFRQLFDPVSCTYTYLIGDPISREAIIIDPVYEQVDRDLAVLLEHGLSLTHVLETHVHADHITGANLLRQKTGARSAVGQACGAPGFDQQLVDGDEIRFGGETIKVMHTPGHTPGGVSFFWRDRVFTGDSLLIGGCGRTDFQNGNTKHLYHSVTQKLFALPEDTLVYPGHDYKGRRVSTIGEEKATNPRFVGKSETEFAELMAQLNLPKPRRIDEAVPANKAGGTIMTVPHQA
jgi:glyoxylase-like metal-dependent hydrolase (beta-lactamase superfamily II)